MIEKEKEGVIIFPNQINLKELIQMYLDPPPHQILFVWRFYILFAVFWVVMSACLGDKVEIPHDFRMIAKRSLS